MLGAGTLKATLEDCLLEMKVFQTITHKTNLRNAKRCSLKKKKKRRDKWKKSNHTAAY